MKNSSPADFYRDALLNAPYPAGLVYLARHIMRDVALTSVERSYLMSLANHLYGCLNGQRDIYFDL